MNQNNITKKGIIKTKLEKDEVEDK